MRLVLVAALTLLAQTASAEWKPEYAQASPEIREWYRTAELTDAAQRRMPFKKCCDHADVVKTQFKVSTVNGEDEWYWFDKDQWRRVPPDIIHWGQSAPGGKPTLFVYSGQETCFWPGEGGL